MKDEIIISGARQHNLKNLSFKIPKNKLVVITGVSGSGKSSLAFDTIYAEGQRRYVESLSAYARQFLEVMDKPDVDFIEGLSPAIAIQQKAPSHNPRSTVGTVTEIYDYLRLLFARIGIPHCPNCGKPVRKQSAQEIVNEILKLPQGTKIQILAPLVRGRIGTYQELFDKLRSSGYMHIRVDGKIFSLNDNIDLERYKKHTIELIIDRLTVDKTEKERITDSVELALKESRGTVLILIKDHIKIEEKFFSEHLACVECGISLPDIEPRNFSFNSPYGACPECSGLGSKLEIDPELIVPNKNLSISEGAIAPWTNPITTRTHRWKWSWREYYEDILQNLCSAHNIPMDKPFKYLKEEHKKIIFYGDEIYEGVISNLMRRYNETESDFVKEEIYNKYMCKVKCPKCAGARLKKESLSVTVKGKSIHDIATMTIEKVYDFFKNIELTKREFEISKLILKEITKRLEFLLNVGLGYLTLDRESSTLAGGEAERIHLATQIGSGLTGVLYVLDEPTVGLHIRDNLRLLDTLIKLRDLGNTLLVVEHDEATIRAADYIIDLGPGAGIHGGYIVAAGTLDEIIRSSESLTGKYLRGELKIPIFKKRKPQGKFLKIIGASQFNLKNIDVVFPLGLFICVTGVSGSGKSTLVYEVLYKALAKKLYNSKEPPGKHKDLVGIEHINKVIVVDQSPIGRTPRSNPATYTGVFTPIRQLFAQMFESKRRGYKPGRFSFNVKGGRCENCKGDGMIKIEMQFLPDVYVKCDICGGKRFNDATLEVKYRGKNIYEVLEMTIEEAYNFFEDIPHIKRILQVLNEIGLGYMKLGQPATTLSGGEAQRVKLASELCRRATGKTLYILDEPTTGLHYADVEKLLRVLHKLVDMGNTVIVIEHNMEVIKTADWIIDLGPEGGDNGGEIVTEGSPEEIVKNHLSYTGQYLTKYIS